MNSKRIFSAVKKATDYNVKERRASNSIYVMGLGNGYVNRMTRQFSASCRSIELSLRLWWKWIHINETHCVPNVSYTQMQMMANVYACEMNLFSVRQMVFSAFQL